MTRLKDTPLKILVARHEELVRQNRQLLNAGQFEAYRKNCQRIAKLSSELWRRHQVIA